MPFVASEEHVEELDVDQVAQEPFATTQGDEVPHTAMQIEMPFFAEENYLEEPEKLSLPCEPNSDTNAIQSEDRTENWITQEVIPMPNFVEKEALVDEEPIE